MSRSLQVRALLSLLPLLGIGSLAAAPVALVARHPGTQICHHASVHEGREMWVDDQALDGHLEHGDNFGACPGGMSGGGGGGGGGDTGGGTPT